MWNKFKLDKEDPIDILEVDNSAVRDSQITRIKKLKAERNILQAQNEKIVLAQFSSQKKKHENDKCWKKKQKDCNQKCILERQPKTPIVGSLEWRTKAAAKRWKNCAKKGYKKGREREDNDWKGNETILYIILFTENKASIIVDFCVLSSCVYSKRCHTDKLCYRFYMCTGNLPEDNLSKEQSNKQNCR